jgi:cytochrome b
MLQSILIWDAPTRVFHWLQVISFVGAYWTAESERYRDIHLAFGYVLLGLIAFRLLWGFIGTPYARFDTFWFKPVEILTYLISLVKKNAKHYLGHNPLGSVAVWLLLGLGASLCVTGVYALQDDASDAVISAHGVLTNIMLVVIAVHILGVFMSSVLHKENLVRAMITGYKMAETKEGIQRNFGFLGIAMLAACAVFVFVYLR